MSKSDYHFLIYFILTISAPWVMIPLTIVFGIWMWVYNKFYY